MTGCIHDSSVSHANAFIDGVLDRVCLTRTMLGARTERDPPLRLSHHLNSGYLAAPSDSLTNQPYDLAQCTAPVYG